MGQLVTSGAIFLSAGVPDPTAPHFVAEGDSAAISAAVSALLYVTLGRRRLVWGGHPAITPMVWAFAESMDIDYSQWVTLYQSLFFEDDFPEENSHFKNVTLTESIRENQDASLNLMRRRMFEENNFDAGVFIGGMKGILDEYRLFQKLPNSPLVLPIKSTGGATQLIDTDSIDSELSEELDYVALFHRKLGIDVNEKRYRRLDEQPKPLADRIDKPQRRPDE